MTIVVETTTGNEKARYESEICPSEGDIIHLEHDYVVLQVGHCIHTNRLKTSDQRQNLVVLTVQFK